MGIETAFGASVYFFIGHCLRGYEFRRRHLWLLAVPVAFVVANQCLGWNYQLNMKKVLFRHPVLDIVVPVAFTFVCYVLSLLLLRVPYVNRALAFVGRASLTIFFTHAAVLDPLRDNHPWTAIALAVAVGLVVDVIWRSNRYTRYLFLGEK